MKIRNTVLAVAATGGLVLAGAGAASASPGQTTTPLADTTAAALVASLVGDGTQVSNVTFTGADTSSGRAAGFGALGVDEGVALTTGTLADALPGPNSSASTGDDLGAAGDAQLAALAAEVSGGQVETYDAAVLEFDFVPTASNVAFTYVFGSEEYPEWVGEGYNDVFAFYVNGVNYATVDEQGTSLPVSVDTINATRNSSLFVDNEEGGHDTQLDGFTTPLGFSAPVNPGQVNHIKLAIADVGDGVYDSAVVLKSGTFRSNTAPVADDKTATTEPGKPVGITLTGSDAENDPLTFAVASQPEHGALSGTGADLVFTPAEGFTGTTTFTYTVSDGSLTSQPATVTITVTGATPTGTPTSEPTGTATAEPTGTATAEPTGTATSEPTGTATAGPGQSTPSSPAPTPLGDGLATTGAEPLPFVLMGAGAVLAAGALLLVRRLRRAE